MAVLSGIDTYTVFTDPYDIESTDASLNEVSMLVMSDNLLLSLLCANSCPGFMVMTTVTMRIAIIPTTTRSSMRVKAWRVLLFLCENESHMNLYDFFFFPGEGSLYGDYITIFRHSMSKNIISTSDQGDRIVPIIL